MFKLTKQKIGLLLLCFLVIIGVTACGSEYEVPGEENALEVLTCSKKNLFGFEKAVVFDDRVVVVLDKERFNDAELGNLEDEVRGGEKRFYVTLSNLSQYDNKESSLSMTDEKYVITSYYSYDEKNMKEPGQPVTFAGFSINGRMISISDEKIALFYTVNGENCMDHYFQTYDRDSESWGSDQHENVPNT